MAVIESVTKKGSRYSSESAAMTLWFDGRDYLDEARIYWLATVRPDGSQHITPLFSVWVDNVLYFCSGENERKAKNLALNTQCIILTGCNTAEGLDVVAKGNAVRITDHARLERVAARYTSKYNWRYDVRDHAFVGPGGKALVYEVHRSTAFGKGDASSQTRWQF